MTTIKKVIRLQLVFLGVWLLWTVNCHAQSISSSELIKQSKLYDAKPVLYKGEVIGDIMRRRDYAWINVNDGFSALGIWIKNDLTKDIRYAGSYRAKGDIVEIQGVFHRACLEHGGDMDIHASAMNKITPGAEIFEPVRLQEMNLALILLIGILSACLFKVFRPRRIHV